MSKGKRSSGARPGRTQLLRGTKGKRKGAGLWYVGFFFSSRRRHTRCGRDWSSDVCSSDLSRAPERSHQKQKRAPSTRRERRILTSLRRRSRSTHSPSRPLQRYEKDRPRASRPGRRRAPRPILRSEERRVGKERK